MTSSSPCDSTAALSLPTVWPGCWIGQGPLYREGWSVLLRREFELPADVAVISARAYVCGLGLHEFYVNGERVGDAVLEPAHTDYEVRCLYVQHEVGPLLRSGVNALGLHLGDGFYHQARLRDWPGMQDGHQVHGRPKALLHLRVLLADGRLLTCDSDLRWQSAHGPVVQNNLYAGETHDARLEQPGWSSPSFFPAPGFAWFPAVEEPAPGGRLEPQAPLPPIRRVAELAPVAVTEPREGVFVFDFGENLAGWCRLRVARHAGMETTLRFAEALGPDGLPDFSSLGVGFTRLIPTDRHIAAGDGVREEIWEPRFTYHGFRYVELTNYHGEVRPAMLTAVKFRTDFARAGDFRCSNERLNALHRLALRSIEANAHGLPSDCPAREKCGWTGDAWLLAESTLLSFDADAFYRKYLGDIAASRAAYGTWMHVVPGRRHCLEAVPLWSLAQVYLPWAIYWLRGDQSVLEKNYDTMAAWLAHVRARADSRGIVPSDKPLHSWDDHASPSRLVEYGVTFHFFSTAAGFVGADLLARSALALGRRADAVWFRAEAERFRADCFAALFQPDEGSFGTQAADAFALETGLADGRPERAALAAALVRRVEQMGSVAVGCFGLKYIYSALCALGREDLVAAFFAKDDYPSFGQQLLAGATTLWETWEGHGSLNHPFKGSYVEWFYGHILGLRSLAPGFAELEIRPGGFLLCDSAEGWHDTPRGRVEVAWAKEGARIRVRVNLPPGVLGTVVLPGSPARKVAAGHHELVA